MKKVGLMFAGQGAQFVGMGKDLYENNTAAKAVFDRADSVLGTSLSELCFGGPEDALTDTANCQPAIYAMSIACLEALREKVAFEPIACGGLSLGEFAALHAAGGCDFDTGLKLLQTRGNLMAKACAETNGGMAAVMNAQPELVSNICSQSGIDVANFNCPGQIVISGPKKELKVAMHLLGQAGVSKIIELQVAGAFHSRCMQSAAKEFGSVVDDAELNIPNVPLVQNFTGQFEGAPDKIAENLKAQVTGSVRWEQCVRAMIDADVDALVELGPGKVLTGFVRRIDRRFPVVTVGSLDQVEAAASTLMS
jgi:[acyl-carrier-protein] S-malonyltransferase